MRILVTNDDGIDAPGIITLVKYLSRSHDVQVVAPDSQKSAIGHAITIRTPIWAKETEVIDGVKGYAVNGTPADCVKLGLEVLMDGNVDLVVSGINEGPNLGTDILYSGTVSGALEGALMGKPSIAISCSNQSDPHYESAAKFLVDFLEVFNVAEIPRFSALNVNVPSVPYDKIRGWRITRQSSRRYRDKFEARKDPFGNTYYWMFGEIIEDDESDDADYVAINNGYVSITPISVFLTDWDFMEKLKEVKWG
ncbi:MAG: 5'/3'-nucleotidase SurE [Thermotoga sp.]|nr:MAG: 5'/3'-nucleotidase SurE [Thermotoga sp.]